MSAPRGYQSPATPGQLPTFPRLTEPPPPPPLTVGVDAPHPDLLTDDEHKAIQLAGELWNLLCRIVGHGRSAAADLGEVCAHIHNLQHTIMAQAAARAYPDRYRLLGGTLTKAEVTD